MRGHRDLEVVTRISVLCAVLALAIPIEALSLLFAAPLLFFLPGYAIVAATFAQRPLQKPHLLVLSLGLSLSTLALGAIVLNYAPGGIRAFSWALLLVLVVLAACRGAALRRARPLGDQPQRLIEFPHLRTASVGLLVGAVLAATAALALAFTPLPAKHVVGYTALWIKPLNVPEAAAVRIGVDSEEKRVVHYRLQVQFGFRGLPTVRTFKLEPGQTLRLRFEARNPPPPGSSVPVTALLYREALPDQVYRRVWGWVVNPGARR